MKTSDLSEREINPVPVISRFDADLKEFFGDVKHYPRKQILQMISVKFFVFKDFNIIQEYLAFIISSEGKGKKHSLQVGSIISRLYLVLR